MNAAFTCIVCPRGCRLEVSGEPGKLAVSGHACPRGPEYARREVESPARSVTTTVRTVFHSMPRLPVRTDGEIPLALVREAVRSLDAVLVGRRVRCGDVILADLLGTGTDVVATDTIDEEVS